MEIFKSDNDPSGYGEGQTYLGFLTSDANGNFSGSLTVSGLAAGDRITGTATDGSSNTSEFGANVTVAAPGYQPDAMIKLASEGAGAYATDNVYEATAATQVKSQGVVSASTATYNLLFQNDGNVSDNVAITQGAADNCAGFTVQYLDNTSTDRTAAVTGGGYTISGMAAGAGTTWTLRVTPPGTVNGGSPACRVSVTATSAGNGTKVDQVRAITSSTSANLTLLKNADRATVAPGQDITYTVNASNGAGLTPASVVVVADPIPAYTGFKVGSATFSPGTSTLSGTPVYSSDNGVHLDVSAGQRRVLGPRGVRLLRDERPVDHHRHHAAGDQLHRDLRRPGEIAPLSEIRNPLPFIVTPGSAASIFCRSLRHARLFLKYIVTYQVFTLGILSGSLLAFSCFRMRKPKTGKILV